MSEPPDDRDKSAATADLEELLEQFREPDEPSPKAPRPLWVILAMVASVLALVLALRIGAGRSGEKRAAGEPAAPLLPTKASDRTSRMNVGKPVDALADYIARCERGMTAREVWWIVEDFQKAGLDFGDGGLESEIARLTSDPSRFINGKPNLAMAGELMAKSIEYAMRQREWYGSTLADGLRLNSAQRNTMEVRLEKAFASDRERFELRMEMHALQMEAGEKGGVEQANQRANEAAQMFDQFTYFNFLRADSWLEINAYAPWRLCDLDPRQLNVTPLRMLADEQLREELDSLGIYWFDLQRAEEKSSPFGKNGAVEVDSVFPTPEDQRFPTGSDLVGITSLHPAQLKLLLLLNPEVVEALETVLKKAGE